jgi:Protein of unknown function (DUF3078)
MNNTCRLALLLICFCSFASVQGQIIKPDTTSNWKRKFVFNFNVNQASFSSNWSAGGINSLGFSSLLNYKFNYKKDRGSWDNEIDMLYGFVNNAGQGFRKTTDRIYLDTKYGYQLNKNWDLYTSLNFLSQFSRGFKYEDDAIGVEQEFLISDFLAPAFITAAVGFEYHPVEYFKVRISPFSPRLTVVNDPERFYPTMGPNPYGLDSGKTTRFEWLAAQIVAEFNKDIAQNINLKWRYLMFLNYETIEPKTIDHRLDLNFTAKVNRFITVGLGGILLYDYDQDSGIQLSQALTIGFAYSFQNYREPK